MTDSTLQMLEAEIKEGRGLQEQRRQERLRSIAGNGHTPPKVLSPEELKEQSLTDEANEISETYELLLEATIARDHSRVDALLARTYRKGISRERTQEELLRRWAERRGIDLTGKAPSGAGRVIGKADPGAGIQQLQPGFVLDHDLHVMVADAGAGKTFLTLELATVLSVGRHGFLDQQAPRNGASGRGTVLYIGSDGGPSAWPMLNDYCDELEAVERGASIEVWAEADDGSESAWSLTLPCLDRLAARVARGDVLGVIIDTANAVFQQANLSPYVGPVDQYLRLLKGIVCPHAFLWINTHTNRNGKDMKATGGHPAWQEVPSVIHRIERLKNVDGEAATYRWTVEKFRSEAPRTFTYQWRNGEFIIVDGHYHENVDDLLLALIASHRTEGMPTSPAALIAASERSAQSVYSSLKRLRQGRLIRSKGRSNLTTPAGDRRLASIAIA
ncbi:AAA family ATPase [Cyanobium sp. Lug-B]|uniref:AAA family ATPase n=1 Tax=Cyanobium sp. Lug-B TaxID=2823716 RepID=UPI0020CBA430|nr:AAA family ATPase [Cyanobium sp. Lug-B]MCP9796109.1 AAA family ATPase [Cyanobium sp. Lug-B]